MQQTNEYKDEWQYMTVWHVAQHLTTVCLSLTRFEWLHYKLT